MFALVLDILPFIVFVIVEKRIGLTQAIAAALVFGSITILHEWFANQSVEPFFLISFALLILCSIPSYYKQNDIFFKLQPSIVASIFGAILLGAYYIFDISMMTDLFEKAEQTMDVKMPVELDPNVLIYFSRNLGYGCLALSGIMLIAAFKLPTFVWLGLRILGLPIISVICFQMAFSSAMASP